MPDLLQAFQGADIAAASKARAALVVAAKRDGKLAIAGQRAGLMETS
jgi:hypothetical protein